jgi:hypothetical protein
MDLDWLPAYMTRKTWSRECMGDVAYKDRYSFCGYELHLDIGLLDINTCKASIGALEDEPVKPGFQCAGVRNRAQ